MHPAFAKTCFPYRRVRFTAAPVAVALGRRRSAEEVVVGRGRRGRAGARHICDRGDVGGDVVRVGAGDQLCGHPGARCSFPLGRVDHADGVRGRRIRPWTTLRNVDSLKSSRAGPGERVVQVRADLPLRARVRERVARAALLLEELFAVAPSAFFLARPPVPQPARGSQGRERRPEPDAGGST